MKSVKILILFCCIIILSCNNKNNTATPNLFSDTSSLSLKVYEDSFMNISLNGVSISAKDLEGKFNELKEKGGIVFYSSQGATEEPPENSEVIEMVKKYQLPIKMFTDSTFNKAFY